MISPKALGDGGDGAVQADATGDTEVERSQHQRDVWVDAQPDDEQDDRQK
jgi:hypothetical protein